VFETGRRAHGRLLTLVGAQAKGASTRLGIVASRKLGNAVRRNRAKRLIREVFRTESEVEKPLDLVVIPKAGLPDARIDVIAADYRSTLRRLTMSIG
jgi:ribonuclease P protein component